MTEKDLKLLLAEGLDLCERAHKLDEDQFRADFKNITPAVWAQQAYDKDLADWESRVRSALL